MIREGVTNTQAIVYADFSIGYDDKITLPASILVLNIYLYLL
jgi:hypothetical protein